MTEVNNSPVESTDDLATRAAATGDPPPKPTRKEKLDSSSLASLKGKTLDDDVIEQITSIVEAEADRRVSNTRKKWEEDLDKKLNDGRYMTNERVTELIEKKTQQIERRAAAKVTLVESLRELGLDPKKNEKGYSTFKDAFEAGVKAGDWSEQVLLTRAGIRTVAATAGLIQSERSEKADESVEGVRGHNRLPDQGVPLRVDPKTGKAVKSDGEGADPATQRRLKMQAALDKAS